jgi:hypothetical protein
LTVYSDLLRQAAAARGEGDRQASPAALVAAVVATRSRLSSSHSAAEQLSDQLAYDLALVAACSQLGIEERLTAGEVSAEERTRLEEELARAWPGWVVDST